MLLPSLVQVWSQFLGPLCLWQCFYFAFRVILSLSALINYNTITLSFRDENCPKFHFQFLSLSSVFNMTPMTPMHDNCCLPSRKTWTYSCGLCPSVFNTWDEKVCHNLHHFVPCTNVSQDTTQQRPAGRTQSNGCRDKCKGSRKNISKEFSLHWMTWINFEID